MLLQIVPLQFFCILMFRTGAFFGPVPSSLSTNHQTQLAKTQFAYQLMRCKPIFSQKPGFVQFSVGASVCSLLFFFHPSVSSFCPPYAISFPFFPPSRQRVCQIEPRPLEIQSQWIWSSQQSSGRRSMKRRKRGAGWWRRLFRNWRLSWTAGRTVIFKGISCQLSNTL